MKSIEGKVFNTNEIVLKNPADITKVWDMLEDGENFIISYNDDKGNKISEVAIASDLLPRVKNNETVLKAVEEK